jgi:hypothetical protein
MLCYLRLLFDIMHVWSEGFHLGSDLLHHIDELSGFGRRDPGEMDPVRLNSHMFHEVCKKGELSASVVITFQVMAFAGMSAGHPDPIGSLPKGRQGEFGTHAAGAGDPDHTDIGGILHPADTCEIGGTIAAPIAEKTDDLGFPFRHISFSIVDLYSG